MIDKIKVQIEGKKPLIKMALRELPTAEEIIKELKEGDLGK